MYENFLSSVPFLLELHTTPIRMSLVTRLIQLFVLLQVASFVAANDGFVKLDFDIFKGLTLNNALKNAFDHLDKLTERDEGAYNASLQNEKQFYVSKVKIGTPASEVSVLLDTGSSDLWVMSGKNPHCSSNSGSIDCDKYGTYNEDKSSTFNDNKTEFSIQYLDQTYANGTWGTDNIAIGGGIKLENASFAVADDTDSDVGVFGIGFKGSESKDEQYSNLPITMKEQGFINKVAYSLYLTSEESTTGSILFGAYDKAKYTGDLATINVQQSQGQYVLLAIPLTSVSFNLSKSADPSGSGGSSIQSNVPSVGGMSARSFNDSSDGKKTIYTQNTPALLDSGTTLTMLPQNVVEKIAHTLDKNSTMISNQGYTVPCSLKGPGNSLIYKFNSEKDIEVPLSDLILDAGQDPKTGQSICALGIVPGDQVILGDNFLRSCYSVFNLDDKTISIAQMNYTDDEDIQVIN